MNYDGNTVEFGKRSTSKFIQLLQIILLSGPEGTGKATLLELLYGFEDSKNQNNSMNNLIYRLRRQMAANGLPAEDCILMVGNRYIWNPEIPVELDTSLFEQYLKQAEEATGREKEKLLEEAFELYRGELLPAVANETWVITESLKLKEKYAWCVKQLDVLLRERKEYQRLYEIYTRASRIYPFDEWQGGQIDCLIFMERYQEAYRLYSDTAKLYSEEMDIMPSEEMVKKIRGISGRIVNAVEDLDHIRKNLQEEERARGAYYCNYPGVLDICQVVLRSLERSGSTAYFLMCTIVDGKFRPVQNEKKLEEMAELLQEAIKKALRRGDYFTRYSKSQYLIVLQNIKKENCTVISDRINKVAAAEGYRGNLYYHIAEMRMMVTEEGPPVIFGIGNNK